VLLFLHQKAKNVVCFSMVYKNVWSKRRYSQQHLAKQQFFSSLSRKTLGTTIGPTIQKQALLLLLNARIYLHYSVMYFLYQMFNEICNKTVFKPPLEYVL